MKNLENYMKEMLKDTEATFWMGIVDDYLQLTGYELTKDDVKCIEDNGYSVDDFDDRKDDYPIIIKDILINQKIESAVKNIKKELSDIGMVSTFWWAYKDSVKNKNNIFNFNDSIWDSDVENIVKNCKEYNVKEISISNESSGIVKTISKFIENGCELVGMIEVNGNYDWIEEKHRRLPAFKLIVK